VTSLHWSLEDPAAAQGPEAERLAVFRRVLDEIEEHVRKFVAQESRSTELPGASTTRELGRRRTR